MTLLALTGLRRMSLVLRCRQGLRRGAGGKLIQNAKSMGLARRRRRHAGGATAWRFRADTCDPAVPAPPINPVALQALARRGDARICRPRDAPGPIHSVVYRGGCCDRARDVVYPG